MRADDLKGRAVVSLTNASKLGQVEAILVDSTYRMVLGFRVSRGLMHRSQAVLRSAVTSVGADAITVESETSVNSEDRFPELTGAASLLDERGSKIVTTGGQLLGVIRDIELDDTAEHVVSYGLDAPLVDRLRHREPVVRAADIAQVGAGGIMIVPDAVGDRINEANA